MELHEETRWVGAGTSGITLTPANRQNTKNNTSPVLPGEPNTCSRQRLVSLQKDEVLDREGMNNIISIDMRVNFH